ncbi:MAG: radical SAM protein, partial [Gammaproteobacteria bacterium]|nr:radical SAM protein [Gammaproteobacteria bacterium]
MLKTLFLNPPSFNGFDGGAGSRYQCTREVKSFWYPTWLAQLAALVEGSRLIDAPAGDISLDEILPLAKDYEFLVLYTSTPSFPNDVKISEAFKQANPKLIIGFCGPHVAVNPDHSVLSSDAIDFVAGNEFDFTIKEIAEGKPLEEVDGIIYKKDGKPVHNKDRALIEDMDSLPWVTKVYKENLATKDYYNGYMLHPYMSFYTGRGCKSRCTFCLWPQTISGHNYRTRSVDNIIGELTYARDNFPEIKEFFFDDDTLTDNIEHVEALAREIGKLGITWSCNAKANVPYETLKIMKDNGLRLLLVGYESGSQQILVNIKKGLRTDIARQFTRDCHKLGILIHG